MLCVPTRLCGHSSTYLIPTKMSHFPCFPVAYIFARIKPSYGRSSDKPCILAYCTATWAN